MNGAIFFYSTNGDGSIEWIGSVMIWVLLALSVANVVLIAIAVAVTTQCEMCLESHVAAATKHGATEGEIAEATFVASAIRAGGAFTHGMKAFRMLHDH